MANVTDADREAARVAHRRYSKPDTELQLALEQDFARHREEATRELAGRVVSTANALPMSAKAVSQDT